ncbi:NfeD family protein [Vibrio fortis]|uniref:NfeD family protein n=1 Tax=Vibrio fortis TaxID=212667 RepID=A0A066UJK0_9VIBR|nr:MULTISPECIES: NfeD family protein [Vibrio]KAB0303042.1 NfeD family protein [Vibrio fortis]KDN27601.1 regulatory protein [Vibrio fortis]QFT10480.1 Inner membrane protein YbbJ [Vibrio sp. THAF190c]
MIELLDQVNHWHWLAFGLLLLGLELLGTAGYFLWIGISAMIVGALLGALPLSWQMQWLSFASFSLITTWLWWRRQLKSDRKSDKARVLNQRDKQLIGKTTRLEDDIQKGKCRIRLGDTTWSAITATDITAGTEVVVTAVDGIVLTIAPVNK